MSRAEKDHRNQSRRGKRTTEIKNRRIQEKGRRASESLKRKLMLKSFEPGRQVGIKSGYAEGYEKGSTESWQGYEKGSRKFKRLARSFPAAAEAEGEGAAPFTLHDT